MAMTNAERQAAWRDRRTRQLRNVTEHFAAEIKTLRTELEAVRAENAALKAALSIARHAAAPKPARRPRDLAQFLYPSTRRQERP